MAETAALKKDEWQPIRWGVYALLIAVAMAGMASRLMQVRSTSIADPSPFLSANDRSRWCTIRSLGDQGTYAIDDVIFNAKGDRQRAWHTIDLVKHRGRDSQEHFYSSKPTLLPTLMAGEYWLIKNTTGASLSNKHQTFYVARLMLLLSHVLPLIGAMWLVALFAEKLGTSQWGRIFVVACATQATFLSTFAITLNNHVVAAVAVIVALAALWPVFSNDSKAWWRFVVAGLAAAFAVTCELPALAFFAMLAVVILWRAPLQTLVAFTPAAVIVFAAALGTNYLAHESLKPAYAHRYKDGPVLAQLPADLAAKFEAGQLPPVAISEVKAKGIELSPKTIIEPRTAGERWVIWDEDGHDRLAVQLVKPDKIEIRAWDDWYDYEGTYWTADRLQGVDKGEPSVAVYIFNCLIGHHGLFSLTPIWLFSVWGLFLWLRGPRDARWFLAAAITLLTLVVLAFYFSRPLIDRNYGGVTSGLRWLFWLIPLWLLAIIPAADATANSRWGRIAAVICFAISVFSANYAALNPWSQPWLFEYWYQLGWINY
ncbi:emopamil-binding family protein [Anatilimnocola floriformis]|uniref:emopamil-binding family protein n=1 Tax=Anatilimnocola floriformis TaxID=2948575 RepID=UPI0020C374F1|nr:emopamil-binding family protein [Anatilimnocola floriformis]